MFKPAVWGYLNKGTHASVNLDLQAHLVFSTRHYESPIKRKPSDRNHNAMTAPVTDVTQETMEEPQKAGFPSGAGFSPLPLQSSGPRTMGAYDVSVKNIIEKLSVRILCINSYCGGHWHSLFGFLVTSPLDFKNNGGSLTYWGDMIVVK